MEAQKLKQLGNDAYKKKDYNSALKNYEKAIELEPNEITYYLNTAAVHYEMKKFPECVLFCVKACKIGQEYGANPNLIAKGFQRMGRAHLCLGNQNMAKLAFEKALKENKTSEYEELMVSLKMAKLAFEKPQKEAQTSEFKELYENLKMAKLAFERAQKENKTSEYEDLVTTIELQQLGNQMEEKLFTLSCKPFEIKGKGKGYIAIEDIEIGTLVMKEKLQCVPKIGTLEIGLTDMLSGRYSLDDYHCSILKAFFSMSKKDQKEFLKLSNNFLDTSSLSDENRDAYLGFKRFAQLQEKHRISDSNFVLKILCIFVSNMFDTVCKGVGLKISRFNHSCRAASINHVDRFLDFFDTPLPNVDQFTNIT